MDIIDQIQEIANSAGGVLILSFDPAWANGGAWEVDIEGKGGGTAPTLAGILDVAQEILQDSPTESRGESPAIDGTILT